MDFNEQKIFDALLDRMRACRMDADESVTFVKAAIAAKRELERADGSTSAAEEFVKTVSDVVDGALKGKAGGVTKRDLIAAGLLPGRPAEGNIPFSRCGIRVDSKGMVSGFGLTTAESMLNEAGSPMIFRFWLSDGIEYEIYMDGSHTFPPGTIHQNLLGLRLGMAEALLKKAVKGERITDADIDSIFK
ncbi:MAG TPA: hypothetical protein PKE57_03065 [Cellvibrionaceae bacterium]|nr:hypothetical protein [Cellvibrionaceae bacterium]HMW48200.1 hypothetical protein [Cellvibrionaceae bacterium]HNG59612.1 hypothetical protein [Cellvibrionaceae bacterium]